MQTGLQSRIWWEKLVWDKSNKILGTFWNAHKTPIWNITQINWCQVTLAMQRASTKGSAVQIARLEQGFIRILLHGLRHTLITVVCKHVSFVNDNILHSVPPFVESLCFSSAVEVFSTNTTSWKYSYFSKRSEYLFHRWTQEVKSSVWVCHICSFYCSDITQAAGSSGQDVKLLDDMLLELKMWRRWFGIWTHGLSEGVKKKKVLFSPVNYPI